MSTDFVKTAPLSNLI